jgi:hypothetical protein
MWFYLHMVHIMTLMGAYISSIALAIAIGSGGDFRDIGDAASGPLAFLLSSLIVWWLHWRWLRAITAGAEQNQSSLRGLSAFIAGVMVITGVFSFAAMLHDLAKPLFQSGVYLDQAIANGLMLALSAFFWVEYAGELRRYSTSELKAVRAGMEALK